MPSGRPSDDQVLTPQRILDATEEVLRRYGPTKANVADVARALRVSPGSIYRHFPSKVALREAVTRHWLDRIHAGLRTIADENGPAPERLERWMRTLFEAKRDYAVREPELFGTYMTLVSEFGYVETEHLAALIDQLTQIIESGVERGEYGVVDATATARTVLWCTTRFNHPLLAGEWEQPDMEEELHATMALLNAGLAALDRTG